MPQPTDADALDFFADCESILGFVRRHGFVRSENAADLLSGAGG